MNLQYLPLSIACKDENKIFNGFYGNNHYSNNTRRKVLHEIFLSKINYIAFFHKTTINVKILREKVEEFFNELAIM